MTSDQKIALLTKWVEVIAAMEAQLEALERIVGSFPESPLHTAIYGLENSYTAAVALLVGDTSQWLEWFRFDNAMGKLGHAAGRPGQERQIKTVADLVWVMEV